MVRVTWTEISIQDLKEIFDFIAEDSIRYAAITSNKIYHKAQGIATNPYLGRMIPEFNEKFLREIIVGDYRVIYRIKNDEQVDILRVYHSARLLSKKKLE
jgi:toxin ParE1/3/4